MGRSVADAALLLSAQVDDDPRDPFARAVDPALLRAPEVVDLSRLKVAVSEDLGCAPVDDAIRAVFRSRIEKLAPLFGSCEARDPELGSVHQVFEILRGVNFVAAHKARLEEHRDLLGPNIIDNTERGLKYSLADVAWANLEQTKIYRRFIAFMDQVDVLICPACAVSPFPHEQLYVAEINGQAMDTYMRWLAITYGITMTTHPVALLPCGRDDRGLPFGIQVVGRYRGDAELLGVAHSLERVMAADEALARPLPDLEKIMA